MRRLLTATLLLSCWAGASPAQEPDKLIEQGKLLAMTFCAECHAVSAADASPHAQAPAFRVLDRRVDLDTFFQRLRTIAPRPRDISDLLNRRRAAKYTPAQKLMHAVLGTAVLVAVVTGFIMLAKVDTPLWKRNPYLLESSTWGVVYVLHGAAALVTLTLTMAHIYFSLLPEKRAYLRAMVGGQMSREEAAQFHDLARWSGQRKDDPGEDGK